MNNETNYLWNFLRSLVSSDYLLIIEQLSEDQQHVYGLKQNKLEVRKIKPIKRIRKFISNFPLTDIRKPFFFTSKLFLTIKTVLKYFVFVHLILFVTQNYKYSL